MPHNSPENVPLITYLWVIALSLWAGIANNVRKIKAGAIRFSIAELIGDIVISGFIGVVTYFLCQYYKIDGMFTAALVGISAHMGTRAIYGFELLVAKKFGVKIPEEKPQTKETE